MKPFIFTLLLFLSSLAQAFEEPNTAVDAAQYQRQIQETRDTQVGNVVQVLRRAERYARQKLWNEAIAEYETVIASGENKTAVWLLLSEAWQGKKNDYQARRRALQAAYNAYRAAQSEGGRSRALFMLGELYERLDRPKQAMAAFKEGLGLADNPKVAVRYKKLVEANAFQIKGVEVESNSANPQICVTFSENLQKGRQIHYEDYLLIQPSIQAVVSPRGKKLCVEGVRHGRDYEITVRPGVPAANGEKTAMGERFNTRVDDRTPTIGFRGSTYILPKTGRQGLPLTTVNVDRVKITLLRVNDRNLLRQINDRRISTTLDGYDIRNITDKSGEQVWQGHMDIHSERNQELTTAIPTGAMLEQTEPGIYVVAAQIAGEEMGRYDDRATQWLIISDLGLSTYKGTDGLHVFVRSLDSALPLPGVELQLYARNNSALGQVVTDNAGYARFDPGLLRGEGGRGAAAVMAYHASDDQGVDFNFLDLNRPAFDLSDRGVEGRQAPGPVDAFLYTERGVYRPGETVELMTLVRDARGYGLEQTPLTLKLIRPDQVEADRFSLSQGQLGGYHSRLPLARNARSGTWKVRAYTDPEADPVGEVAFQVEDFVPQRIRLELETEAKLLIPGTAATVDVSGQFLYGAPAGRLKAEGELVLREDKNALSRLSGVLFRPDPRNLERQTLSAETGGYR